VTTRRWPCGPPAGPCLSQPRTEGPAGGVRARLRAESGPRRARSPHPRDAARSDQDARSLLTEIAGNVTRASSASRPLPGWFERPATGLRRSATPPTSSTPSRRPRGGGGGGGVVYGLLVHRPGWTRSATRPAAVIPSPIKLLRKRLGLIWRPFVLGLEQLRHDSVTSLMRHPTPSQHGTDFAEGRGFPGKCRSRTVESNSDPRSLPLPGRHRTPAAATPEPVEEVTQ
jgi:hypothetical protein